MLDNFSVFFTDIQEVDDLLASAVPAASGNGSFYRWISIENRPHLFDLDLDPETWPEFPIEDPRINGIWIQKDLPAILFITTEGRLIFMTFDSPGSFNRAVAFYCFYYFPGIEIRKDFWRFFRDPTGLVFR